MKQRIKKVTTSWGKEITLIVDEKLNKLKGKILAPKKLEEANKHLRRMKSLPKQAEQILHKKRMWQVHLIRFLYFNNTLYNLPISCTVGT